MNRAFYNGVGGVKTQQFGIDTWGNNIANISTNGFKANLPQFSELFSDKLAQISNSGPVQSDQGFGARAHSSAISMKQGSVVKSEREFDVAIMGDGWFGVGKGDNVAFTRNGSFSRNAMGDLVNNDGAYVMGTLAEGVAEGDLTEIINFVPLAASGEQAKLRLPDNLTLGSIGTQNISIHGNLGLEDVPEKFATKIITSTGEVHTLNIKILKEQEKSENGTSWMLTATISNQDGEQIFESEPGKITFSSSGSVLEFDKPKIDNSGVDIDLNIKTELGGLVAFGGSDIGKGIQHDGVVKGNLTGYHVDKNAQVIANFDNGRASAVGKIALFHFQNDQGLTKMGDNLFSQSINSGEAFFFKDSLGRDAAGTEIVPNSLEKSNVSTAEALTQLIIMQKAFGANSKSISTGDQLLQTALKML